MSTQPPIPKTALVVDDSMLIRHSVCRFLEERGFIVESATNGVEALEVLSNFVPDIIITDLSMPRMGGVELVSRIRQLEVFADTPILVLAARRSASELFNELPSRSRCRHLQRHRYRSAARPCPRHYPRVSPDPSVQRNSRFASADMSSPANSLDLHFE